MSFFNEPQGAAILKHGILKRYLPLYATKVGSVAGEVLYLDCYAGPGLYGDGSDGSPALALATADALAGYRGKAFLHGHLIEKDRDSVEELRELLEDRGAASWEVHHGRAEAHVPRILATLDPSVPMFAFIDPFGLPIPFEMVAQIMRRSGVWIGGGVRIGAATEVLMNFSKSGINRVGGQLTGAGTDPRWLRARDTMVDRLDAALGGQWWHDIWRSGDHDRVDRIRKDYAERLRKAAGAHWAYFDIGVSDKWQGPATYQLLLFTQHEDGVWGFHECLSSAYEDYRAYCHHAEGMLDLEPLAERELKWVQHIEENVERLLATERPFKPVHYLEEVFGDAFGEAREKHLRKALKNLHSRGKLSMNLKGRRLGELTLKP